MNTIISQSIFGIPPTYRRQGRAVEPAPFSWCSKTIRALPFHVGPMVIAFGGSIAPAFTFKGGETLEEFLLLRPTTFSIAVENNCSSAWKRAWRAHKSD